MILFPLIEAGSSHSYRDEQEHSARVDEWLGLQTEMIEAQLTQAHDREKARDRDERYWIGLPAKALLTPYTELRSILERLHLTTEKVVDLGAGYGRMGFVIARHFPSASFLGIEVVRERVSAGAKAFEKFMSRLSEASIVRSIEIREGDLASDEFEWPAAKVYFLYDFGSPSAIEKVLQKLMEQSLKSPITVIGRGGATRDAIERRHAWLSQVKPPEHFPHYSIYRS